MLIILIILIVFLGIYVGFNNFENHGVERKIQKGFDNNSGVTKLNNYSFKIVAANIHNNDKQFILNHNDRDFYYCESNMELYLCEINDCYTLKEILKKDMVKFDDILLKAGKKEIAYDGGSAEYYFSNFNIVVCNNFESNNKDVYISNTKITVDFCS